MKHYILIDNETKQVVLSLRAKCAQDFKKAVETWAAQPWANADGKPSKVDWSLYSIAELIETN